MSDGMRNAILLAITILLALFIGAGVQSCGSNAEADAAKAEAELAKKDAAGWRDSTARRDERIVLLEAEKNEVDQVAADSIAAARADANESERAARAAQSRAAQLVAKLERMVPDTGRAVLAEHVREDSIAFAAKDATIASKDVEIRQLRRQHGIDERLIVGLRAGIVSRDSTIAADKRTIEAQDRAIDALETAGFRIFGIRLDCVAGAGASAGAGGAAAGPSFTCGVPLGG